MAARTCQAKNCSIGRTKQKRDRIMYSKADRKYLHGLCRVSERGSGGKGFSHGKRIRLWSNPTEWKRNVKEARSNG